MEEHARRFQVQGAPGSEQIEDNARDTKCKEMVKQRMSHVQDSEALSFDLGSTATEARSASAKAMLKTCHMDRSRSLDAVASFFLRKAKGITFPAS